MKRALVIGALVLTGCAAAPELDGRPTSAIPAAALNRAEAPVWTLDFGDAGLRRMLAEADSHGLDVATARARFLAADLTLAQVRRDAGIVPSGSASATRDGLNASLSVGFEPDLAGKFDAAIRAAVLQRTANGLDLYIARRTLGREVVKGWIDLAEAQRTAARAATDLNRERQAITLMRARVAAGEAIGADLVRRQQARTAAARASASAQGRVALAKARLRALGVQTVPGSLSLKSARVTAMARQTDLRATASAPQVCAAWLRFRASDADRARTLAEARPRLVLTATATSAAKTLAGLISGNAISLTNSIRLEGNLVDNGAARNRLDQARLSVAQAEIAWLQARSQAEIAALEAVVAERNAEATLTAALEGWQLARTDLRRVSRLRAAGLSDRLDELESEASLAVQQAQIDSARAARLAAAAAVHDALPPPVIGCTP